jgi:hypothetical protein
MSEFFCKCPDFTNFCHPFDDTLFKAAMLIRYFTKVPVIINSSYRIPLCNKNCGGVALDLNCGSALEAVTSDIVAKGPLYRSLRQCGINGFGISPSFLHIDTLFKVLPLILNLVLILFGRTKVIGAAIQQG